MLILIRRPTTQLDRSTTCLYYQSPDGEMAFSTDEDLKSAYVIYTVQKGNETQIDRIMDRLVRCHVLIALTRLVNVPLAATPALKNSLAGRISCRGGGAISSMDISCEVGDRRFFLGELLSDSESYTGASVSDSHSMSMSMSSRSVKLELEEYPRRSSGEVEGGAKTDDFFASAVVYVRLPRLEGVSGAGLLELEAKASWGRLTDFTASVFRRDVEVDV